MSRLTIQQRNALHYATTKVHGDREVRAQRIRRAKHSRSSTPVLQCWLEDRGGWFLCLLLGLAVLARAAGVTS
ncbi:hypothetical protein [Luteibacter sp. 621]|uniref:hypothetical protein n=1 Tax=Luteibacter sp. 621 TaxID=3373916 RepID=UPI003D1AC479